MINLLSTASENVVFSDSYVWTFLIQIGILSLAILFGNFLRTKLPFIKKYHIPSALIGGIIVLILKSISWFDSIIDDSVMQMITYHCLGLGFAAMALKTAKSKRMVSKSKVVESGAIMAGSYFIQVIVGLIISIIFFYVAESFYAAGIILPMGFGQSTGSALSWGGIFQKDYGFEGGASYGIAVASIGFLVGSVIGVIYLNIAKKKGKVKSYGDGESMEKMTVADFQGNNEIPNSGSIDKFTVQMCLIILVYALTFGFMTLLSLLNIKAINDLAWGLNFLWATLLGFCVKYVIGFFAKKKIIKYDHTNNYLMDRIAGYMFDLMIVAGIAGINFESISKNLLLLVVTCVIGTIVTFFYVKITTSYAYKGYDTEGFLTNFGTVTGTVSTGMILLREIDPDYKTPAATNIVLQLIPSTIMIAPLLLTLSICAQSITHTFIMLGVYTVLFVIYNVYLFRRKIFKGKQNKMEETWTSSK